MACINLIVMIHGKLWPIKHLLQITLLRKNTFACISLTENATRKNVLAQNIVTLLPSKKFTPNESHAPSSICSH